MPMEILNNQSTTLIKPIVHEVNGQKSLYVSPGHLIKVMIDDNENVKKS